MYEVKEIKNWYNQVLTENGLNIDSDNPLIKNISAKIDRLSMFRNSHLIDFYSVRDIYTSIERLAKTNK